MNARETVASWPADLLLISAVEEFLREARSTASYPDIIGMAQVAFERLDGPQQGRVFETALGRFIEKRTKPRFQLITGAGDLGFGLGLGTPSGIRHEIDLVLSSGATLYAFEAKHYRATEVTKDLLAIFNQKTLDFYLELLRRGLPVSMKRLFVARTDNFKAKVREFAWSWGIALLGGERKNPIWLHAQLSRWCATRGYVPDLVEHVRLAEDLSAFVMRDLADLIQPFSRTLASIRLDRLLDPERCAMLDQIHEKVAACWHRQRQPGTENR